MSNHYVPPTRSESDDQLTPSSPQTYKIRAVATSLLNCPFTLDTHMAQRATGYVREFIKVLSYLDHSEVVNTDSLETWVDRDRVGPWT